MIAGHKKEFKAGELGLAVISNFSFFSKIKPITDQPSKTT